MKENNNFLVLYYLVAGFVMALLVDYLFQNGINLFGESGEFFLGLRDFLAGNRIWLVTGYVVSFIVLNLVIGSYRSIKGNKVYTPGEKVLYVALFLCSIGILYGLSVPQKNLFYFPAASLFFAFATNRFFRSIVSIQQLTDKSYDLSPEKSLLENELSFNLPCVEGGYINITNPSRGIFIGGAAGSGKSVSHFYRYIEQGLSKGYAAVVYDYKYPEEANGQYTLVNKVYTEFAKRHAEGKKPSQDFFYLNYHDLRKSHRTNFLNPKYLHSIVTANEIAQTLLINLAGKGNKGDAFWMNNAITLCTGVIWMLKKYYPEYCTLPHVVLLVNNQHFDRVITMMNQDIEIAPMISSITTASSLKAGPQLAGVMSSLQTEFAKILNNRIFWVHSGDDFDLDISNPVNPKWLVIGSHQSIEKSISPLIACTVNVALKNMNQPGKAPAMVLLDEGPQLFIPNIHNFPATMRSNKVAMIYSAQDFVLMQEQLGDNLSKALLANLNYQFLGKVGDPDTAERFAKAVGKHEEIRMSVNDGVNRGTRDNVNVNQGTSFSYQEKFIISPDKLFDLAQGEFVGLSVQSDKTKVRGTIKVDTAEQLYPVEPFVEGVTEQMLTWNYERIYSEVEAIISGEIMPANLKKRENV